MSPAGVEQPVKEKKGDQPVKDKDAEESEAPCVFCLQFSANVEKDHDCFLKSKLLKILVGCQEEGEDKLKLEDFRPVDPWKGVSVCSSCQKVTVTIKALQEQVKTLESRINALAEDLLVKTRWSKNVHTIVPLNNKAKGNESTVDQNKLALQGLKIKGPSTWKRVRKFYKGSSEEKINFFENWVLYRKYFAKLKITTTARGKDVQLLITSASAKILPTLWPKLTMPPPPVVQNIPTIYLPPISSTGSPACMPTQVVTNPVSNQVVQNSSVPAQIDSNSCNPTQVVSNPSVLNNVVSSPSISIPPSNLPVGSLSATVFVDSQGRIFSVVQNKNTDTSGKVDNVIPKASNSKSEVGQRSSITTTAPSKPRSGTSGRGTKKGPVIASETLSRISPVKTQILQTNPSVSSKRKPQTRSARTDAISEASQNKSSLVEVSKTPNDSSINPRVVITRLPQSALPGQILQIAKTVIKPSKPEKSQAKLSGSKTAKSNSDEPILSLSSQNNPIILCYQDEPTSHTTTENASTFLAMSTENKNQRKRTHTLRNYCSSSSSDESISTSQNVMHKSKRLKLKSRNKSKTIIVPNNEEEANFINSGNEEDVPQEDPLAGTYPFAEYEEILEEDHEIVVKDEFEEFEINPDPDPDV